MTAGKLGGERNSNQKTPNKTNKMSAAAAPGETDATIIQERHKETSSQTNDPPEGALESRFYALCCLTHPGWLCHQSQTGITDKGNSRPASLVHIDGKTLSKILAS